MQELWLQDKGSLPLLFSTLGVHQAGEVCHYLWPTPNTCIVYYFMLFT